MLGDTTAFPVKGASKRMESGWDDFVWATCGKSRFAGFWFSEHQIDSEVEQCAKVLESRGLVRKEAPEPIKGVLGGPEYRGGCTCMCAEGSSKQRSEGKASWSKRTGVCVVFGCLEGDADAVHWSCRGMGRLPVDSCARGSRERSDEGSDPFDSS